MDSLYFSCDHGWSLSTVEMPDMADNGDLFSFANVEAFTKRVYKGAFKNGSFDKKRVNQYARAFGKAIENGFKSAGGSLNPDFDTPDAKMLAALRDNVFHFSAAKNRTEIEAMSAALRDEKGRLRSFKDFTAEARKITNEFQGRYMKSEYNLAVNASTMAARWADYEDDVILVYETAHDNRVRPEHASLDGISKPKNDPFWNVYYPPNGWNCRCTVMPTTSGRITPDGQIPTEAIDGVPPLFRSNFAKEGLAFPKDHPYFKALEPEKVEKELKSLSPYIDTKEAKQWGRNNLLNKTASNPDIAKPIRFNMTGIKEFLNQPYEFKAEKPLILKNIITILQESKFLGVSPITDNPMFLQSYILETKIKEKASWLVLRENINGEIYFYSISDGEAITKNLIK